MQTQSEKTSNQDLNKAFFGIWKGTKVVAYGPVIALSDEEEEFLQNIIEFSHEKAVIDNEVFLSPQYYEENISKGDFWDLNYVDLKEFEVSKDYITEVNINSNGKNCGFFWIKDEKTIILIHGGVYFEFARESV